MRFKSLFVIFIFTSAVALLGCGSTPTPNANNAAKSNNAPVNNTAAVNAPAGDDPTATTKKAEVATTNNAPTIGPVVQTYFTALKKSDDAALKSVLASAYLAKLQADMKKEKKTGLAAYVAEYDLGAGQPMEARNEKIEGDKAVAEIKGGAYANWTALIFVKENGAWKYSGDSPELQSVTAKPGAPKAK